MVAPGYGRVGRWLPPPEDGGAGGREPAAGPVDAGQLSPADLAGPAFAPKLLDRFDEEEDAAHPGLARGEPAPIGVGGQGTANSELAVLDERPTLTLRAEPEPLQGQDHHGGEGVVDLDDVDVIGRDPGSFEG